MVAGHRRRAVPSQRRQGEGQTCSDGHRGHRLRPRLRQVPDHVPKSAIKDTYSFAHRGYRIAAFCLGKCMLPCANCQNFLHGSRLSALAAVRYSPRGARRKKLRQNAQNWDFTVSHENATLIESRTPPQRRATCLTVDHATTKLRMDVEFKC